MNLEHHPKTRSGTRPRDPSVNQKRYPNQRQSPILQASCYAISQTLSRCLLRFRQEPLRIQRSYSTQPNAVGSLDRSRHEHWATVLDEPTMKLPRDDSLSPPHARVYVNVQGSAKRKQKLGKHSIMPINRAVQWTPCPHFPIAFSIGISSQLDEHFDQCLMVAKASHRQRCCPKIAIVIIIQNLSIVGNDRRDLCKY